MGMIVDKAAISGLFGGVNHAKSGKSFLSILSPGPKIDKFCFRDRKAISGDFPFGTPVIVELTGIEQKFSDFNGSYSEADACQIKDNREKKAA
jgi:hypothetical protein